MTRVRLWRGSYLERTVELPLTPERLALPHLRPTPYPADMGELEFEIDVYRRESQDEVSAEYQYERTEAPA